MMRFTNFNCACLVAAAIALATTAGASSQEGRWKLGDDGSCTFDETDTGPDQCPPPAGSGGAVK